MRDEIAAAVVLVTRIVKKCSKKLSKDKVEEFSEHLTKVLIERFKNHWYTESPYKGQGYRCIRVNSNEPVDAVLKKAAADTGLVYRDLALPSEFTLWVDPAEVSCRFSELKGHCYTVANFRDGKNENKALTLDIEDLIEEQIKMEKDSSFKTQRLNVNKEQNFNDIYFKSTYTNYNLQSYYNSTHYYNNMDQGCVVYHNNVNQNPTETANQGNNIMHKIHSQKKVVPKFKSGITKADRFHWVKPGEMIKA